MNIQPIGCKTYNSKNQNSPNFKAKIVSEFRAGFKPDSIGGYSLWLRNLILANLPISEPQKYHFLLGEKTLIAPLDNIPIEQAQEMVFRLKVLCANNPNKFKNMGIELDASPEELVWVN